ncbi:hypothetical protein K456DRAFT_1441529 [Colletotrichum gloeosporioides 23]|nr:hypothetical protein K456DRAFT_1441529 [Colletotrichum gloeosporioides 23]
MRWQTTTFPCAPTFFLRMNPTHTMSEWGLRQVNLARRIPPGPLEVNQIEPIHLPQRQTANESKGKLHNLVQRWTRRRQASDFGQPLQEYDGSWGEFQKCTCGGNGERRRTGRYRSLIRRFTNQGQSQSSSPSFYSNAWESLPTSRYLVELEGDSDFHGFGRRVELPAQPISPRRRSCQQSQPDTPRPETPLQSVSGQPAYFGTLSSSRSRVERTFEGASLRPANCRSKLTTPFDPSLPLSLLPPIDVEIYKLFEDSDDLDEDSSSYSPVSWEHADDKTFRGVKVTSAGNFGRKSSLPSQSVKPTDHSDNNFKSYVTEEQPQNASEIHYLDEVSRSHSPASWKYDDDEDFEVAKQNTWSGSTNVFNSTVNLGTNFQLKANKRQKKGHFVSDSASRLQSPAATTPRRNYRIDFSAGLNLSGSSQVSGATSPSFSPRSLSERDPGCLDRSSDAETASSLGSHVTSDSSAYSGSFSTSGELTYEGKRRLLLGQLMREVYSIISPRLPSPPVNQLGNEDSTNARRQPTSGTTVKATTSSNYGSSGREKCKRLPDDPDGGRSGGGDGQKRARMDIPDEEGTARLACPYLKRHPQRYCTSKWRSCPGPGWNTVHRVNYVSCCSLHMWSCTDRRQENTSMDVTRCP